jgi:hypothetical protein
MMGYYLIFMSYSKNTFLLIKRNDYVLNWLEQNFKLWHILSCSIYHQLLFKKVLLHQMCNWLNVVYQSIPKLSSCCVSLQWLSHFIYCYAECHHAECHIADFRYAECHFEDFHYAECHYVECHYAECHYAYCRYAECHYIECSYAEYRGT